MPKAEYISTKPLIGLDHSYIENTFATGGDVVQVWNYERSHAIQSFDWGMDSITSVRFNQSEPNLIAATSMDRSVCLYDI